MTIHDVSATKIQLNLLLVFGLQAGFVFISYRFVFLLEFFSIFLILCRSAAIMEAGVSPI